MLSKSDFVVSYFGNQNETSTRALNSSSMNLDVRYIELHYGSYDLVEDKHLLGRNVFKKQQRQEENVGSTAKHIEMQKMPTY